MFKLLQFLCFMAIVIALGILFASVGGLVLDATGWTLLTAVSLIKPAAVGSALVGAPLGALIVVNKVNNMAHTMAVALSAAMFTVVGACALGVLQSGQLVFAAAASLSGAGIILIGAAFLVGMGVLFCLKCTGESANADLKLPMPEQQGVKIQLKSPLAKASTELSDKGDGAVLHVYSARTDRRVSDDTEIAPVSIIPGVSHAISA